MKEIRLEVNSEETNQRIDKYLSLAVPDVSRSYFQKLLKDDRSMWERRL